MRNDWKGRGDGLLAGEHLRGQVNVHNNNNNNNNHDINNSRSFKRILTLLLSDCQKAGPQAKTFLKVKYKSR